MPLSERERRILDALERDMITTDQKPIQSRRFHRTTRRPPVVGSTWSAVGALAGLGYVLLGAIADNALGVTGAVIGFALIVVSCSRAVGAYRRQQSARPRQPRV